MKLPSTKALQGLKRELCHDFWEATLFPFSRPGGPRRVAPCFFRDFDDQPCYGAKQACHFLKRQRVESVLEGRLPTSPADLARYPGVEVVIFEPVEVEEFVLLAAWDPRNAVCGCLRHHTRFDHYGAELTVPESAVPDRVNNFLTDLELEDHVADRIKKGI